MLEDRERVELPVDQYDNLIKSHRKELDTESKRKAAYNRRILVKLRAKGMSMEECAQILDVTPRTCYNYEKEYKDPDNVYFKPNQSPGPKPKLTAEDIDNIRIAIRKEELTAAATVIYIKDHYGVDYCENQVRRYFSDDIKVLRRRKKKSTNN